MRAAPPGILCALVTPFDGAESPDLGALGEVVDFQADAGTQGIFVLGTTGEGVLLGAEDRCRVAAAAVERAAGRLAVVVHCGAPDTRTAEHLARHAQDVGADGVATVAPYYFRSDEVGLLRHFTRVAAAAREVAHYVYENPEVTGYAAGVPIVTRLIDEVPNIVGVKDTGDSLAKITRYLVHTGTRPDVYVGNNLLIFPALAVGAAGSVSAMANAAPELVTSIYSAWLRGDLDEARARQFDLARLHGSLEGVPFLAGVKHLVARRGLPAGGLRGPLSALTPDQVEVIERRLAALPELARWLGRVSARR